MSVLNVNSKRWLPAESEEQSAVFRHAREVAAVSGAVSRLVLRVQRDWRAGADGYVSGLRDIQMLDELISYLCSLVRSCYKLSPRLARLPPVAAARRDLAFQEVCARRFLLLQSLHGLLLTVLETCTHRDDTRKILESCFALISVYNQLLGLSHRPFSAKYNLCSNTCPALLGETKPITLTKVVQILSKSRVEINCQRLINCLVKIYKPDRSDNETGSSTSGSLEIYHALTKHITPPSSSSRQATVDQRREAFTEHKKVKMKQCRSLMETRSSRDLRNEKVADLGNSDSDIPYTSLFINECIQQNAYNSGESLNGILQSEELYVQVLLDTAAQCAPAMLGASGVKRLTSGGVQARKKAACKVTEYYQSVLWGEVGSCLEHVVLWWSACPLAIRSPNTSQNLREWLMTFNVNNTPELVLSALRILADSLGCHVTSTSWDKLFGSTLRTNLNVTSIKQHPDLSTYITECTVSGANFALMLQQLVTLSNQCEVTAEYTLGAPLEDLPIVEQIPILHRLDHSIHTYRLWCVSESRRLAGCWAMRDFFRVTQHDMAACMEQLLDLRLADHTLAIETGHIGVHENVCANMREKLVSEVKINIQKLKDASEEITCVLSSVCSTTSLAHLSMVFPSDWRRVSAPPSPERSSYVHHLFDTMLLPVIEATDDVTTLDMVLRIMCESWLHHIYVAKVKFSKDAALQLLFDFNEVRVWLSGCARLAPANTKLLLHNEVLRRCEGVGRLLLHAPGDLISMQDSSVSECADQLMPAEMYVPNQKQWLSLRATLSRPLCC